MSVASTAPQAQQSRLESDCRRGLGVLQVASAHHLHAMAHVVHLLERGLQFSHEVAALRRDLVSLVVRLDRLHLEAQEVVREGCQLRF